MRNFIRWSLTYQFSVFTSRYHAAVGHFVLLKGASLCLSLLSSGSSERCRRARGTPPSPFPLPPPRGTSGRRRRCEAWSSPAWGLWVLRRGTGPRRSPGPRSAASSGPWHQSWPRCEPSPGRSGWGSPCADLWRKTSSVVSPKPPRSLSVDPGGQTVWKLSINKHRNNSIKCCYKVSIWR